MGKRPYAYADSAEHPAKLNVVLVGDTASRKGTAYSNVRRVLASAYPEFMRDRECGGFGSGESLVDAVSPTTEQDTDSNGKPVTVDIPGEPRLLVLEPELARLLAAAARQGSTLSAIVRQAYDGGKLEVRSRGTNRQGAVVAHDHHIGLLAQITPEELRERLTTTDVANGFANRMMFFLVKRSQLLPHGGDLSADTIEGLAYQLRSRVTASRHHDRLSRTAAASRRWEDLYEQMADYLPGGVLGAVVARAEAHVLRLSVIYAVLDASPVIDSEHLEAAWALWEHSRDSAAYLWGSGTSPHAVDRLHEAIQQAGSVGLSLTECHRAFSNNRTKEQLERWVTQLLERGRITRRSEETGGRPRTVYVST